MRLLLSVEHPAWVHQFKYVIRELEKKGHAVKVVAIKKDVTCDLLDAYNIPYQVISDTAGKGSVEKGVIFLKTIYKIFSVSRQFKPDMYIGRASPMMAINSFLFQKPHILFEDSEPSHFSLWVCNQFSDIIITPQCFTKNLGKKQVKIDANKELFYLHPSHFHPDPQILELINLEREEKFIVLRFVAWNAHHDIGQYGIRDKVGIVKKLEAYGRVYITSEDALPSELKKYQIAVPPEKIHDLLYFATVFFSDSQTMTTEAALLGTPAVRCNSFVGENDMGNFVELEKDYGLIFNCKSEEEALSIAIEILKTPNIKNEWAKKRENLLKEKIDVTAFMTWFVENYPRSFTEINEHPENKYSCPPEPGENYDCR